MFTTLPSEYVYGQFYDDIEMNDQSLGTNLIALVFFFFCNEFRSKLFIFLFTDVTVPQFICMGKISSSEDVFHPNSYVCSREFDSVLNNHDPYALLYKEESVCLFNKHFVFEEAFFSDMDLLLNLAR